MIKLKDLKNGDFVVKNNGSIELVASTVAAQILLTCHRRCIDSVYSCGWNDFDHMNDDLTSSINSAFDIMEVFRPRNTKQLRCAMAAFINNNREALVCDVDRIYSRNPDMNVIASEFITQVFQFIKSNCIAERGSVALVWEMEKRDQVCHRLKLSSVSTRGKIITYTYDEMTPDKALDRLQLLKAIAWYHWAKFNEHFGNDQLDVMCEDLTHYFNIAKEVSNGLND